MIQNNDLHGILLTRMRAFSARFKFLCAPLTALYRFSSWKEDENGKFLMAYILLYFSKWVYRIVKTIENVSIIFYRTMEHKIFVIAY